MKTTRTAPRNLNIVTLRRGAEWTRAAERATTFMALSPVGELAV